MGVIISQKLFDALYETIDQARSETLNFDTKCKLAKIDNVLLYIRTKRILSEKIDLAIAEYNKKDAGIFINMKDDLLKMLTAEEKELL